MTDNIKIAIVGGGPAGIIAAYAASLNNDIQIDIYERNEKLGKKLYITGKGRCNVTNAGDAEDFFNAISKNKKFFYSAYYTFDNYALMSLIEENGTKLITERGNRVFPESGKSSDIIKALKKLINKKNINIFLDKKINHITKQGNKFILNRDIKLQYDKLILAGGGKSYPVTGSDGNTYQAAKNFGHTITDIKSGLCGINTSDNDTIKLSGLSLKNVVFNVTHNSKTIYSNIGEMEFTHFGISGPLVLSASSLMDEDVKSYSMTIDLKPGLDFKKLEARILRDIQEEPKKEIKNSLGKLLPFKLMEAILYRSAVDISKKGSHLTKDERSIIINNIKSFIINPISLRPIEDAIITRGGINCNEINPSTMESKLVHGLYFAGEILDLDACTGGFNLQIAFSTGYLAGLSASL